MSNRNGNQGGANRDYRDQRTDQSAQNLANSSYGRTRDAIDDCSDCPACTAIQEKVLQDCLDKAEAKRVEAQKQFKALFNNNSNQNWK
jgi:hypothetical protein